MLEFVFQAATFRCSFTSTLPLNCSIRPVKHRCGIRAVASEPVKTSKATSNQTLSGPKTFDWKLQWYPVAVEHDVPRDEPYAFKLFDSNLVLFEVAHGKWSVLDDRCSHRLAPLSEGRIVRDSPTSDAEIECAYHGWAFGGCGKCIRIPQLESGANIPRRAHIRKYATKVENGIIFCFFGDPELSDQVSIFVPDEAKKMSETALTNVFARDMNSGFEVLLENIIDQEHVHFLHHSVSLFFNRKSGGNAKLSLTSGDQFIQAYGFNSGAADGVSSGAAAPTTAYVEFNVPGLFSSCLVFFLRPSTRTSTTMFMLQMRDVQNPLVCFGFSLVPTWVNHLEGLSISDGDELVLSGLQSNLGEPATWKNEWLTIPNQMDALIMAYRTWMDKQRESIPWLSDSMDSSLLPQTREEKLNRWVSHTQHCKVCHGAWRSFKIMSSIGEIVAKIATMALIALLVSVYLGSPFAVQGEKLCLLRRAGLTLLAVLATALFFRFQCYRQASRFVFSEEARLSMLSE